MNTAPLTYETINSNTIINGDCLHIMLNISAGSVDFILTDPPYITRYQDRAGRSIKNDDNATWLKQAFAEMYRVLARDSFCISFYGWPQADRFMNTFRAAGFRIVGHLVFPKRYTCASRHLRYQHECAYLLAKGYSNEPEYPIGNVIDFVYSGNKLHPTENHFGASATSGDVFKAL